MNIEQDVRAVLDAMVTWPLFIANTKPIPMTDNQRHFLDLLDIKIAQTLAYDRIDSGLAPDPWPF